jgi:hypothetical protein
MADDQEKTEDFIILYEKGTSPFFYAKAAWATKVKSLQDFSEVF